jgi:hypothetical protein
MILAGNNEIFLKTSSLEDQLSHDYSWISQETTLVINWSSSGSI